MKRFIISLFFILISAISFSQNILWYRATAFSYKETNKEWSDWKNSSVEITFDINNKEIIIYTPKTYKYTILKEVPADYEFDTNQTKYYVVDNMNRYGYIRFRIMKNDKTQIYIDYPDTTITYNIIRFYL